MDMHLLRRSVEMMYRAAKGATASAGDPDFGKMVKAVARNGASAQQQASIEQFLLRQVDPNDLGILREADGRLRVYGLGHHIQVMARAGVLLRLATAASADLLDSSGYSSSDLDLWRNSFATRTGLWDSASTPIDPADLWADVQNAIDALTTWEGAATGTESLFAWRAQPGHAVEALTVTDRVVAWAF